MKERLKKKELHAIQLFYSGLSEVDAYKQIFPSATEQTANGNASNYFKKIRNKLNNSDLLELSGLNTATVLNEIKALLQATTPIYYQGELLERTPDNNTRFKVVDLLTKILHIADKTEEETATEEDNTIKIIIEESKLQTAREVWETME